MDECDIGAWVEQERNPARKAFREAVHTVLFAVANSPLHDLMILKGGLLLAFRYHSRRHTRDLDFSTAMKYDDFDRAFYETELEAALSRAVESLDYGLDCRVQRIRINPNKVKITFPTLITSVGYAPKGDRRKHRRLLARNSSDILKIDYSFNEISHVVESLRLLDGGEILTYSLSDLVAEKYRAILQQEIRKRTRRQDAYDLYFLFNKHPFDSPEDRARALACLLDKSVSRGLKVERLSLRREEIERRSRQEYALLEREIPEPLPDFDVVYGRIREFYEALPWEAGPEF